MVVDQATRHVIHRNMSLAESRSEFQGFHHQLQYLVCFCLVVIKRTITVAVVMSFFGTLGACSAPVFGPKSFAVTSPESCPESCHESCVNRDTQILEDENGDEPLPQRRRITVSEQHFDRR